MDIVTQKWIHESFGVPQACTLKGWINPAQGNTLGRGAKRKFPTSANHLPFCMTGREMVCRSGETKMIIHPRVPHRLRRRSTLGWNLVTPFGVTRCPFRAHQVHREIRRPFWLDYEDNTDHFRDFTKMVLLLLILFPLCLRAQTDGAAPAPRSVNEATMISLGSRYVKNTYLSDVGYDGTGIGITNERMRLINDSWSRRRAFRIDFASIRNPAGTSSGYAAFLDYSYAVHRRFEPGSIDGLRLLVGATGRTMLGTVYRSQGGNNPAALHLENDLGLSLAALYSFDLSRRFPVTLRWQADLPLVGIFFSPHYGQSYYEIFTLGHRDGIVCFGSLHNRFALRSLLTADMPVGPLTVRIGYEADIYRSHVNGIRTHYIGSSLLLGVAKEFIPFSGRRVRHNPAFRSAYY